MMGETPDGRPLLKLASRLSRCWEAAVLYSRITVARGAGEVSALTAAPVREEVLPPPQPAKISARPAAVTRGVLFMPSRQQKARGRQNCEALECGSRGEEFRTSASQALTANPIWVGDLLG